MQAVGFCGMSHWCCSVFCCCVLYATFPRTSASKVRIGIQVRLSSLFKTRVSAQTWLKQLGKSVGDVRVSFHFQLKCQIFVIRLIIAIASQS